MEALQGPLGVTSGVLALAAAVAYIRSILRGETKPERGAYIIWGLTSTITFVAYWADGAEESVWFAVGDFIVGVIMVALALKYGYGWHLRRHSIAFMAAFTGLVLWALTDQPFLALLFSIGVDAIGSVLVAIKSYEAPYTENLNSWLIYLVATVLATLAVGRWDFTLLFFPVYAFCATTAVVAAILLGRAGHAKRHGARGRGRTTERIP